MGSVGINMGSVGIRYSNTEYTSAIEKFTSNQYKNIRLASIGQKIVIKKLDLSTHTIREVDVTDKYKKDADILESYIKQKPNEPTTLYRGISVDNDTINTFKKGAIIDQKGISSWTKSQDSAKNFGVENSKTPNKVIFVETQGTRRGRDISSMSLAVRYDKNEVIQSAKNRQKITDVKKKNGVTYVYVKEI